MEVLILILTTTLLYAFLRMHGGEGLSIKGQFAPASTTQGKRDRVIVLILTAMVFATIINMLVGDQWSDQPLTIAAPFLFGMVAFVYFYQKKKNDK